MVVGSLSLNLARDAVVYWQSTLSGQSHCSVTGNEKFMLKSHSAEVNAYKYWRTIPLGSIPLWPTHGHIWMKKRMEWIKCRHNYSKFLPIKFGTIHGISEVPVLLGASKLIGLGVSKLLVGVDNFIQPKTFEVIFHLVNWWIFLPTFEDYSLAEVEQLPLLLVELEVGCLEHLAAV